jgi:hypothetical protein
MATLERFTRASPMQQPTAHPRSRVPLGNTDRKAPPGRIANSAIRLGLILAFLLAGCTPGSKKGVSGGNDPDASLRYRAEMRVAPPLPASIEFPPPDVSFPDVPQDRPAQERARAALLQRLRTELLDAYQQYGRKNLRWDAAVREALEARARFQVRPAFRELPETVGWYYNRLEEISDDQVLAWQAAHRAVGAGCTDPLIFYLLASLSYGECAAEYGVAGRYWVAAAEGMLTSQYPAYMKAIVFVRTGDYLARQKYNRTERDPEAERWLDEAMALIPAVTRECQGKPDRSITLYHLAALLVESRRVLPRGHLESAHYTVVAALSDPSNQVAKLLLIGDSMCRLAWESRGHGTATEVSADDWDRFDSQLARGEEALKQAWELEPTCGEIPHLMMCIETYLDRGRDRMEQWFERAMRLNGDDYYACMAKLEYLEPRWHGSEAELLGFGRACLRTQNWEGRLPFILLESHRRLARYAMPLLPPASQEGGYITRAYVWSDIQAIYEPYLAKYPGSFYDKSCYARLAAIGGHYEVANRLFEGLGANWWHSVFGNEYMRLRAAARNGKALEAPGRKRGRERDRPAADGQPLPAS